MSRWLSGGGQLWLIASFPSHYSIHQTFERKLLRFCSCSWKFSLWNWHRLAATPVSNLWKFSPPKSYFRQVTKVFSLERFPLYSNFIKVPPCWSACDQNQVISVLESRLRDQGDPIKVTSKRQRSINGWLIPKKCIAANFVLTFEPLQIKRPRVLKALINQAQSCQSKILITVANTSTGDIYA